MTTNLRSSTMSDQYRTVVQAVVRLTTQVRRIADALAVPQTTGYQPVGHVPEPTTTPVTPPPVSETTTGDDARRCVCGDLLQWYTAPGGASGWAHDPAPGKPILDVHKPRPADDSASWAQRMAVPDWRVVNATMRDNEQLRAELAALRRALDPDDTLYIDETVDEQRRLNATIDRLRTTLGEVLATFSRAHPAGEPDTTLGYQTEHPIHPDDVARWRAAL